MFLAHVQGTPYVLGGNTLSGTDCSGLVAWVSNIASGREPLSGRFGTGTEQSELASRGFVEGTAPGALVVGLNDHHTAITLPDGTAVASGESGGIGFGGGGAYQAQFTRHMYLPVDGPPPDVLPFERPAQFATADDAPPPGDEQVFELPPAEDAPPPDSEVTLPTVEELVEQDAPPPGPADPQPGEGG